MVTSTGSHRSASLRGRTALVWLVVASMLGGCTGASDVMDRFLGRGSTSPTEAPADAFVPEAPPTGSPSDLDAGVGTPVDLDAVVGDIIDVGVDVRATIGADGGALTVATSASSDVQVRVPAGALPDDVELSIGEVELPDYRGARVAAGSPAVFAAAADDAMAMVADQQPPFPPMQVLAATIDGLAPVGPMLRLEPAGTTFDAPVEVVLPFDTDAATPLPVLISADGTVELLEPEAIDRQAGTVTVSIDHLSILGTLGTLAAIGATLYLTGPGILRNGPTFAAYAIGRGPIAEAEADVPTRASLLAAIVREVLCGQSAVRSEGLPPRPSGYRLLQWLAFGNAEDEIGDRAVESQLRSAIRARGDEVIAAGSGGGQGTGGTPPEPFAVDEVFQQALAAADGDVFRALLSAHNVLRDFSNAQRNASAPSMRAGLARLRATGDDPGAWYHMFGTATFTYLTRANTQDHLTRTGAIAPSWRAEQAALLAGGLAATVEEMFFADTGGDMTGDPAEYLFDLRGTQLGVDLFATFNGRDHDDLRAEYGIDDDACDDSLRIARLDGPAVVAVDGEGTWVVEFVGGVPPYEVQVTWSDGREAAAGATQASAEIARTFTQPGDYVLMVTGTDADGTQAGGEAAFEVQNADDDLVVPEDVVIGSGDVQATLIWNGSGEDLDLHVIDPAGEEIAYYSRSSTSGGELDRDVIPGCEEAGPHVENVFWPEGGAPAGRYEAWVDVFRSCDTPSTFRLEVRVGGQIVETISGSTGGMEESQRIVFEVS